MATEVEYAWAAGLFEGEGSIHCQTTTTSAGNRRLYLILQIQMTDLEPLARFHSIVGVGNLTGPYTRTGKDHWSPKWKWACCAGARSLVDDPRFFLWLGERRRKKIQDVLVMVDSQIQGAAR